MRHDVRAILNGILSEQNSDRAMLEAYIEACVCQEGAAVLVRCGGMSPACLQPFENGVIIGA